MGLDMYLTKKIFIGANYNHRNVRGVISLTGGEQNKPINIQLNRVSSIEERVGYWRKANQIHKWFVENIQNGVDDCGEYKVSEEKLEALLALCKNVKENPVLADEALPTQKGFFFGNTEYDEDYIQDIDDTIKIITAILEERGSEKYCNGDFYYTSSW